MPSCHELGFGVERDAVKCETSFKENEDSIQNLEQMVEQLKETPQLSSHQESRYRSLLAQGHFNPIDLSQQYRKEQRLWQAESQYQREVETMGFIIGNDHFFVQELRRQLSVLLMGEGRFKDAEGLLLRMIELDKGTTEKVQFVGRFVPHLAVTYWNLGRCKEAEELEVTL